jgi:hypothetical protein
MNKGNNGTGDQSMRKAWQIFAVGSCAFGAAMLASVLYADNAPEKGGSTLRKGEMINRMGEMRSMMEHRGRMMGHGSARPNDQWRKSAPLERYRKAM